MIEYFSGVIACVTSFIGLFPQIYKSLKTKSASDISMTMLINYLVCSLAWIVYGSASESFFVLSSNIIGLLSATILIFQKRYYDRVA
ncbi:MAG: PQ-loop repeat-containing protein [Verrucomicrobia bacterium]|nr:PQ-loop repeat-containing protein [Verrucomicrobiota bacterium]MBS0637159.1 PQ-loop repeat-containing protein [Verrucomicrobiota bacterium]